MGIVQEASKEKKKNSYVSEDTCHSCSLDPAMAIIHGDMHTYRNLLYICLWMN